MSGGVGRRRGYTDTLLWLWCRLAAAAPIRPLAWEPPYALGAALGKAKRQQSKISPSRKDPLPSLSALHLPCFSALPVLTGLSVPCVSELLTASQTPATSTVSKQLCTGHCADPEGLTKPGWVLIGGHGVGRQTGNQPVVNARTVVHAHRGIRPMPMYQRGWRRLGQCPQISSVLSLCANISLLGTTLPHSCGPD